MQWSSHIEILFTWSSIWCRRVVIGISAIIFLILVFHTYTHPFFKIDFGLLIGLLSVLKFFVTPVYQVITGSDMIVSVILYTFCSIFTIKIELLNNLDEKFFLHWHFLFAREQSLIPIFVFDLQGPSMVPNVIDTKALLWISVQNSSNQIFALG